MSSAENGRLCWISDANRDWLIYRCGREVADYVTPWDAAPVDPAQDIYRILREGTYLPHKTCDAIVLSVLAALGVPDVPQRPTPRDETPS